nr:hypothetical protein [Tanacetum cinerariifolium]
MMSEDSSAAGIDNRPPMLEESDYESWKIRIERYINGKTHGKLIWKSILNGPSAHPAKEIWESLKLLMKGSGQTLDQRKEDLFDEYERFRANGNELIQDYFVHFHKLINDIKVTKLTIPTHQINTKFVNNLPSYWSKYVTSVKNVKNLSTDSYIDLYTHLRSYEEHALKKLKKQEQSFSVVDPLAYLVKTTHQQAPTHSTTTSPSQLTPALASTSSSTTQSHDDAMLATMKQIANLLSGFQKQFPPTNNQLRNTRYRGNQNNRQGVNNKKKAKENGAVLDAEAKAFLADVECIVPLAEPLALTTTNMFQVNHEDAYDSDVNDEANAAAAFMTNLSSNSSQINEVRTFNDNIFETVSPSWPSEVPQDEHLKSDDDSVHKDYTIPYDQYLATKESQDVPTEASPILPTAAYMLQTLTELTTQVEGHPKVNQEQALVNATLSAELDQCKLELARLKRNNVKLECDQVIVAHNKRNAELEQETELLKTTLRNKEATIASLTSLGLSNPWFGRKAQLSQPTLYDDHRLLQPGHAPVMPTLYDGHRLLQPGHAPVMVSDSHETLLETKVSRMKMSQKPGHVTPVDYTKLNALLRPSFDYMESTKIHVKESFKICSGSQVALMCFIRVYGWSRSCFSSDEDDVICISVKDVVSPLLRFEILRFIPYKKEDTLVYPGSGYLAYLDEFEDGRLVVVEQPEKCCKPQQVMKMSNLYFENVGEKINVKSCLNLIHVEVKGDGNCLPMKKWWLVVWRRQLVVSCIILSDGRDEGGNLFILCCELFAYDIELWRGCCASGHEMVVGDGLGFKKFRNISSHGCHCFFKWWMYLCNNRLLTTWEAFTRSLETRFGPSTYDNHQAALFKLQQTSTVSVYQTEFEILSNCVTGLPPDALLNCFVSGLCKDIQQELTILRPQTITQAIGLAKLIKDKTNDQHSTPTNEPLLAAPTSPFDQRPTPTNAPSQSAPARPLETLSIKCLSPADMQKRRAEGYVTTVQRSIYRVTNVTRPNFFFFKRKTNPNPQQQTPRRGYLLLTMPMKDLEDKVYFKDEGGSQLQPLITKTKSAQIESKAKRIEQYYLMTDYSLWEVFLNGDFPASTKVVDVVLQPVAPTMAEQRLASKNELKAHGTLLMALPDKHQLKLNSHKDAKTLMETIEKRFGGNTKTKTEDINLKFLRSLPSKWRTHTLIWRNKTDLEEQSLDDLFNSLKIYEAEVKSSSSASTTIQNIAFMSSSNTDNTNEPVSAVASVYVVSAKILVSPLPNVDSLSNAVIYSFFASQSNSPQLDNDDLKQIYADDLEKMDLKWQMVMKGHFARKCRSPKDTRRNDAAVPQRRNVPVEASTSNALVSQCDGVGSYDWSFQAEEEPTNYALIAFSSSSSSSDNENLSDLLASQTHAKTSLGYTSQVFTRAMFDCDDYLSSGSDESLPSSPIYDRYRSGNRYHAVPPPYTRTFKPPKPDLVFNNAPNDVETDHPAFNVKLSLTKLDQDLSHTNRPSAPIIEDWVSDSEDESETKPPQNVPSFVQLTEQVKSPRPSVQHVETSIPAATPKSASPKPTSNSKHKNRKACFVCKSLDHLIKDCDYHEKKMAQPTARNHAHGGNNKQYAQMTFSNPQWHVVPAVVLTQSKPVPSTVVDQLLLLCPKSRVTAVKASVVNATQVMQGKWEWKPKYPILDHGSRNTSASMTLKRFDYNDALRRSKSVMAWVPKRN